MDDPRLQDWLTRTLDALHAPEEELSQALATLAARRSDLVRSLRDRPMDPPASSALAARLDDAERSLESLIERLRERARTRVAELRKRQAATQGYRPTRPNRPAFVSRSI